jgi:mono/diheme cytochrome c family protein
MRPARFLLCVLSLAISPAVAAAQDVRGNIGNGRHLAERWCGACHRMDMAGVPGRQDIASFVDVARLPSTTALSLRAFLYTSHADMPNIQLSPADADDLIAFILSLKSK